MSDEHTNNSDLYHRMCNKLWTVVKGNGMDDCATLAVDEIKRSREEIATLTLAAEASAGVLNNLAAQVRELTRERDEARAEVERLCGVAGLLRLDLATARATAKVLLGEVEAWRKAIADGRIYIAGHGDWPDDMNRIDVIHDVTIARAATDSDPGVREMRGTV